MKWIFLVSVNPSNVEIGFEEPAISGEKSIQKNVQYSTVDIHQCTRGTQLTSVSKNMHTILCK